VLVNAAGLAQGSSVTVARLVALDVSATASSIVAHSTSAQTKRQEECRHQCEKRYSVVLCVARPSSTSFTPVLHSSTKISYLVIDQASGLWWLLKYLLIDRFRYLVVGEIAKRHIIPVEYGSSSPNRTVRYSTQYSIQF
jgi:hypothetical protein